MRKTNEMLALLMTLIAAAAILCAAEQYERAESAIERAESAEARIAEAMGAAEIAEDPGDIDPEEPEKIAEALKAAIGTEEETQKIGYSLSYVMAVVTHEANRDETLCRAVATALYNGCVRYNGRYTPEELCEVYHYAAPSDFISDAAYRACVAVFIDGERLEVIEDATVFYNPALTTPRYHLSDACEFVAGVSGILFYRELR